MNEFTLLKVKSLSGVNCAKNHFQPALISYSTGERTMPVEHGIFFSKMGTLLNRGK